MFIQQLHNHTVAELCWKRIWSPLPRCYV